MKVEGCGGCGNCADFKCPFNAFEFKAVSGYASASIDPVKCNDCGLCKDIIDCLCEAISE